MELEKIRNLSDNELNVEEHKAAEQLFRLRFQMKLGQNEGVKKLRELKLHGEAPKAESEAPVKAKKTKKEAR